MNARARIARGVLLVVLGKACTVLAQPPVPHDMTQHHGLPMRHDMTILPRDCDRVAAEYELTVHAGTEHSAAFPGTIFGYSQREIVVAPCSRITVTFVNDDQVRHQWMVHGLPRYLYPAGMFHLEANGGQSQTGSLIVPSDDKTYLVHCDLTQHMEKGMKAQLVVGRGSGDLWAIPGISAAFNRDTYLPSYSGVAILLAALAGIGLGAWLRRRSGA